MPHRSQGGLRAPTPSFFVPRKQRMVFNWPWLGAEPKDDATKSYRNGAPSPDFDIWGRVKYDNAKAEEKAKQERQREREKQWSIEKTRREVGHNMFGYRRGGASDRSRVGMTVALALLAAACAM